MTEYDEMPQLRQPPHSIEAEQAVIGAVLERNHLIHEVEIAEADFYNHAHRIMWARMQSMAIKGTPVDPVTLCNALAAYDELEDAGGVDYVGEIVQASRGGHNLAAYAQILKDKGLLRRLVRIGTEISDKGYTSDDAQQAVDDAQRRLMEVGSESTGQAVTIAQSLQTAVDELDRMWKSKGQTYGLSTGLADLDSKTGGFRPGQMIVIAGRPSMGKSTISLNIAEKAAMAGTLTVIFSLEMTHEELSMKMLASVGRIRQSDMEKGSDDGVYPAISAAISKLKDCPLHIDDCFGLTSAQIMGRVRKISQRTGLAPGLVVVDYIQILGDREGRNGNDQTRISEISRNLKKAAVALGCPIIAVSQLNRALEQRPNKRPLLSDLRSSGSIEQDADLVIMAYRDEVYNEDSQDKGIAELIIRKQRKGPTGTVKVASRLDMSRFEDLSPQALAQSQSAISKKVKGADRYEDFT